MPYLRVNHADLWYEDSGRGAETIVFAHGFLMDHRMFDDQVRALGNSYRCVRFDHRGQGRSEVTKSGYEMDSLTVDTATLIRELDCAPCHFAGLSMGGFIGLRLAIRHPELLKSLTLIATSAESEPDNSRLRYRFMARIAAWFGFRPLIGRIAPIMFGRTFLRDPAMRPRFEQWRKTLLAADRNGILRAAVGVLGRPGVLDELAGITVPTLVIVGDEDRTMPLVRAQRIHAGIAGSSLLVIKGAGHSSCIEQTGQVSAAMGDFLAGLDAP